MAMSLMNALVESGKNTISKIIIAEGYIKWVKSIPFDMGHKINFDWPDA